MAFSSCNAMVELHCMKNMIYVAISVTGLVPHQTGDESKNSHERHKDRDVNYGSEMKSRCFGQNIQFRSVDSFYSAKFCYNTVTSEKCLNANPENSV